MLSKLPRIDHFPDLLVGHSTADDAAVLKIDGTRAIVQTVDFFTPIVDDPRLFGAIAATNSVSDIYAMGATPILALAIAAFPTDKLPLSTLQEIMTGGAEKAAEAGFPIAGGHTIIDDTPKYGLAVTGIVDIDKVLQNSTAREGDALYLTKPIGNGIVISAYRAVTSGGMISRLKRRSAPSMDEAIRWMVELNRDGARIMSEAGANAATDVTGYGLIGHLLEMCDGSGVGARIRAEAVPVLANARELLAAGYMPDGTRRNVEAYECRVELKAPRAEFTLLCDAQTSGGLLVAVPSQGQELFERRFRESGLLCARIGEMTERGRPLEILP
jgi:selenium donor protein